MSQAGAALAALMSATASLLRPAADHYFALDATPSADDYCTGYIELQRSDSFRHGNLTADANRTGTRCRRFPPRYTRHVGHAGWPDGHIKRVEIDGSLAHVLVSHRMDGRRVSRNAWVGKGRRGRLADPERGL